ncbi:DoxX family protein [Pelagicoccus sp. SDUM812003]|uniref:DoxX family protein n=1 Tax=Pelagicoccus sp. SDUM812003 TaxID=3041267 RepID=UPI0028102154|nr:DoxX family protein [Pelagicoccus sp. SDUM812003]MDQ8202209.1 DoxX family protein [Pelagicoccus sp. SDUM812003]
MKADTKTSGYTSVLSWIAQIVAAVIFAQTLFFKFAGAEESVYIFSTLGVEPWGRWLAGISELVAAGLLMHPRLSWLGAMVGVGVMLGAIASHLLVLGIEVQDDGGLLFSLALVATVACGMCIALRRSQWKPFGIRILEVIGSKRRAVY